MIAYGEEYFAQWAACDDDGCPWKFRGATVPVVDAAEAHVRDTGHSVTLYVEKRMTLSPKVTP